MTTEFNANARCDKCGHRAAASTTLGELELLWCMHHYNQNKDALVTSGWIVTLAELSPVLT